MDNKSVKRTVGTRKNDPTPIYYRLQNILRSQIENGLLKPGEKIPTERELSDEYGVSIGTVKKALLGLVQESFLYRVQGSGTFVTGSTLRRESLRYYRLKRDFGDDQADLKVNLIGIERVAGRQPHNAYLQLDEHDSLYKMERTFLLDGEPMIYTVSFLPEKTFPKLDELPANRFEKTTLYEALEDIYTVTTTHNHKLFGVAQADKKVAGALNVETGRPMLFIEMLSFTFKETPYEYRQSFCLGEQRKIFIEI